MGKETTTPSSAARLMPVAHGQMQTCSRIWTLESNSRINLCVAAAWDAGLQSCFRVPQGLDEIVPPSFVTNGQSSQLPGARTATLATVT